MRLSTQKRIASVILKTSHKNIWMNPEKISEIKEAITKEDLRSLIKQGIIKKLPKKGHSRGRARKILKQKRKGRRRGPGSLKGKKYARLKRKRGWINKIRSQRNYLRSIKERKLIDTQTYRKLYSMSKGGFFRSRNHIKLYMGEHGLLKDEKNKKDSAI